MPRSLFHQRDDGAAHVQKFNPLGDNRLLQRLGPNDLSRLQPHLTKFSMVVGAVLHAPGAPIEHVYFPLGGMVSLLAVMRTGEQIETAIVGREGVVGASIGSDGTESAGQATVQMAGSAWRIEGAKFLELYQESLPFRTIMNKFQNVILLQTQQSAACHALHSVEARLCRWLLQSQDTTETDLVLLTQDFLSHMLGVRRTSVSLSAHALQAAGLVRYSRGKIKIINREGLKESACECYEVIREHIDRALPPLS
jgi:CRP-like cAMP-binding protein